MLRTIQYDDEKHTPIWLTTGFPFVVNMYGIGPTRVQVAFDFKTLADMERADKVLALCREVVSMNPAAPSETAKSKYEIAARAICALNNMNPDLEVELDDGRGMLPNWQRELTMSKAVVDSLSNPNLQ